MVSWRINLTTHVRHMCYRQFGESGSSSAVEWPLVTSWQRHGHHTTHNTQPPAMNDDDDERTTDGSFDASIVGLCCVLCVVCCVSWFVVAEACTWRAQCWVEKRLWSERRSMEQWWWRWYFEMCFRRRRCWWFVGADDAQRLSGVRRGCCSL